MYALDRPGLRWASSFTLLVAQRAAKYPAVVGARTGGNVTNAVGRCLPHWLSLEKSSTLLDTTVRIEAEDLVNF